MDGTEKDGTDADGTAANLIEMDATAAESKKYFLSYIFIMVGAGGIKNYKCESSIRQFRLQGRCKKVLTARLDRSQP